MTLRYDHALKAASVLGLALLLAACGGGRPSSDTAGGTVMTGATTVTRQEDTFGTVFGTNFRLAAFGEPASVADGDIVAISLTTESATIS